MQSAAVILIGLGMTTIISGGGIDISIGSIMAVCAMVFAGVLNSTGSLLFCGSRNCSNMWCNQWTGDL